MKKVIETIWKFINSKFFGYMLAIIFIGMLAGQCKRNTDLKRENLILEQNVAAADSTITEYKTKEGVYTAEKATWILTEKQLKKENKELYDLVQQQDGRVITLNRTILRLRQDTAILHDSIRYLTKIIDSAIQVDPEIWILPWELRYDWDDKNHDYFKGKTLVKVDTVTQEVTHLDTQMDERDSQIDLTFGTKTVGNTFNVFVESKYPGLRAEQLKGVFIDPNTNPDIKKLIKKRHWFTGFSVSIGVTPTYDFINKQPTVVIGPTIGYTIYQW
jgi:hypothetical protein